MTTVNGNFRKEFIIAIAVGASITVVVLALVCVAAQCGPRLCGRRRKEKWFSPTLEEGHPQELPLVRENPYPKELS